MKDFVGLLTETANAIGMDPLDLATIISYETAGTFSPTQPGPTTKWGQHRGLIQFGEPQAEEYGVDWNDPLNSQLGADGAVAKYMRSNGFQPGGSMMDAYSTVNAGGPGRENATDAGAGGASGTVADKVNYQMDDHRAKAAALMGLSLDPSAVARPRVPMTSTPPFLPEEGAAAAAMPSSAAMDQMSMLADVFSGVSAAPAKTARPKARPGQTAELNDMIPEEFTALLAQVAGR
jgi:hypothetical protein